MNEDINLDYIPDDVLNEVLQYEEEQKPLKKKKQMQISFIDYIYEKNGNENKKCGKICIFKFPNF